MPNNSNSTVDSIIEALELNNITIANRQQPERANRQIASDATASTCDCCGKVIGASRKKWKIKDGNEDKEYCYRCFNTHKIRCTRCNCYHDKRTSLRHGGTPYCKTCFDERYRECPECNQTRTRGTFHTVNGRGICGECYRRLYFTCSHCNESHPIGQAIRLRYSRICRHCLEADSGYRNYAECTACNTYHPPSGLLDDEDGDRICNQCASREGGQWIKVYNYKPSPIFYKHEGEAENNNLLFFGFENEVVNKDNDNQNWVEAKRITKSGNGLFYCKSDGSLSQHKGGFEIVSHPFSYQWLKNNKDKFECIFELSRMGYVSHNTNCCGMHIHISKNMFSDLHILKFLKFFYKTDKAFIQLVSQRTAENLSSWATLNNQDEIMTMAKSKYNYHRNSAINLRNDKTVEIRLFRGTLRADRFYKNIEFVQSVYEFTKETGDKDIMISKYSDYIRKYKKTYSNLYNFLIEKSILTADSDKPIKKKKIKKKQKGMTVDSLLHRAERVNASDRTETFQELQRSNAVDEDQDFEVVDERDDVVENRSVENAMERWPRPGAISERNG